MSKGYIYVLSNRSIPGQLKIGRSKHGGSVRAKDLDGSTGLPTPFVVQFEIFSNDCVTAEHAVHEILRADRINRKREFFECSLDEAVAAILGVVADQFSLEKVNKPEIPAIFDGWDDANADIARQIESEGYVVPDFDVLKRAAPWLFKQTKLIVDQGIQRGAFEINKSHHKWKPCDLNKLREILSGGAS